jgi:hypothetical protein
MADCDCHSLPDTVLGDGPETETTDDVDDDDEGEEVALVWRTKCSSILTQEGNVQYSGAVGPLNCSGIQEKC